MHSFWVPGDPIPQGSMVPFVHPRTKRAMVHASNAALLNPWRKRVAKAASLAGIASFGAHDPIWLRLTFHLARPQTLPKGRTHWPTTFPDCDKAARAILDALTLDLAGKGLGLYPDDAQVVGMVARKVYAGQRGPGVLIEVSDRDFDESQPAQAHLLEVTQ